MSSISILDYAELILALERQAVSQAEEANNRHTLQKIQKTLHAIVLDGVRRPAQGEGKVGDGMTQETLELWQKVFREGFASAFSDLGLLAVRKALVEDDQRLIQGSTTGPPPLECVRDWPVEAACFVGYCGWQNGEGLSTVAEVEAFFARACFEADQRLGEPAACRHFLNWFDETPRAEMRAKLLPEIDWELERRRNG